MDDSSTKPIASATRLCPSPLMSGDTQIQYERHQRSPATAGGGGGLTADDEGAAARVNWLRADRHQKQQLRHSVQGHCGGRGSIDSYGRKRVCDPVTVYDRVSRGSIISSISIDSVGQPGRASIRAFNSAKRSRVSLRKLALVGCLDAAFGRNTTQPPLARRLARWPGACVA